MLRHEHFIRKALGLEPNFQNALMARQGEFEGNSELHTSTLASLSIATTILVTKKYLSNVALDEVVNINTRQEARDFIDKYKEDVNNLEVAILKPIS